MFASVGRALGIAALPVCGQNSVACDNRRRPEHRQFVVSDADGAGVCRVSFPQDRITNATVRAVEIRKERDGETGIGQRAEKGRAGIGADLSNARLAVRIRVWGRIKPQHNIVGS